MTDVGEMTTYSVECGRTEWEPFDWAGHIESLDCPCEPTVDPPYRIHRPFSDPDIQSTAYTETADEPEEAGP